MGRKMTNFLVGFALFILIGVPAKAADYQLDMLVDGLDSPWGLAVLPDGDMLVTELTGQLRLISNGKLVDAPIAGVPESLYGGQGGLMDVVLHPDYASNQLVYLSLSVGTPAANALRIIRGRLVNNALQDIQSVFEAAPAKATRAHYGGRMAFLSDRTLLVTVGDGFDYREEAQNLANHFGTVVRVTDSGKVPDDNPFVGQQGAQPEIWTYGHRNPQSILVDELTGTVYQTEHGPRGGDELNSLKPGENYGWPVATFGIDYSGARISPYTEYPGMTQPLKHWTPSIGPSAMTLYRGTQFPNWQGDIFVTSLVFNHAVRVDMRDGKVGNSEIMFAEIGARLRDIRTGADGALYILSEGDSGKLWRVSARR